MITNGFPSANAMKTEIVDVANGVSCSDMADFPAVLIGAVGANLDGTLVVCSGYESSIGYSDKCFRFINAAWEEFATMKENRQFAAGVMHDDKLHVFSGRNSVSSYLYTSETINLDGEVSNGPDLPTAVWGHAMTKINDTVSLLSGGYKGGYDTVQTWYYNHDTEAFTYGPDLLEGRRLHGSAIIVDKVTNAKIAVVTGGYASGNLDSTEMLINGQWQTGTI